MLEGPSLCQHLKSKNFNIIKNKMLTEKEYIV